MKAQDINFLEFNYKFSSGTGEIEANRYINKYKIEILGRYSDDEGNEKFQLIGKASIYLFLIGFAQNNYFSMSLLFDEEQASRDLGELIIDWDTNDFNEHFQDIICNSQSFNVLYIDRVEILPQFKGNGFGKYIMKDIVCRFDSCCGLIVLKAFPLQLEAFAKESKDAWCQKMEYDKYIQDEKVAKKQLYSFYKSVGFSQYKKSEYFYLDPSLKNKKLDKIHLSDYFKNLE